MSPGETLSPKPEQREELGEVGQPLGLSALFRGEIAGLVQTIEKRLQALVNPGRQTKVLERVGNIDFEGDRMRQPWRSAEWRVLGHADSP